MDTSEFDPGAADSQAWNAGRKVGAKRALKQNRYGASASIPTNIGDFDRSLFDVAIDRKLRGCDVVSLKIGDVIIGGQIRIRAAVVERKTGRPIQFELLSDSRAIFLA